MKIKNHTPSHKVRNSKYLLSSTIEYIKNDLKDEYTNGDEILLKKPNKYLYKKEKPKKYKKKNLNSKISSINTNQEEINQRQSKS